MRRHRLAARAHECRGGRAGARGCVVGNRYAGHAREDVAGFARNQVIKKAGEGALRSMKLRGLACLFVFLCGAAAAMAEGWPAHFVTLVIPFGAGSGSDIVGRIIAAQTAQALGQNVIVEDLGGAGGTIAVSRVAKAPPDGYQIVLGAVDTFAQSQFLFKEPPFNSVTDFVPVGLAVEQPLLLVVRNDLPVSNLTEFAAYLKANQT